MDPLMHSGQNWFLLPSAAELPKHNFDSIFGKGRGESPLSDSGADWKVCYLGNCLASPGLPSDAKELSWATEF